MPVPIIEATAGDTIRLPLTNQLDIPTNRHYHGLHISPQIDNVFRTDLPASVTRASLVFGADRPRSDRCTDRTRNLILLTGRSPRLSSSFTKMSHQSPWLAIPTEGLAVGILAGFVGVGGGFLIIPTLMLLGGIPMKEAIGTSLLIIAAKSAMGFVGYLDQVAVDWVLVSSFTIAASADTLVGHI
ncbi:MAG: TSUP family transporter [Cyanobacteria bacterium P01_A01_bin.17]